MSTNLNTINTDNVPYASGTAQEYNNTEDILEDQLLQNTLNEIPMAAVPGDGDAMGMNYIGSTTSTQYTPSPSIDTNSVNSHREFAKRIMGLSGGMSLRGTGIEVQPVNGWIGIRGGPTCVPILGKLGQITSYTQEDACSWNARPYLGTGQRLNQSVHVKPQQYDTKSLDTLLSI